MAKNTKKQAINVKALDVSYGEVKVLDAVDLSVAEGETFGLIGLNGTGKTTMIKTILGLRSCDGGEITIDGQDRRHFESKKKTAYLPERFNPPWFLSGIEFIKFSLDLYGVPFDRDHVSNMADRLSLDHKVLGNRVQTYSKGMQQKLGLIATILSACPVMILDEPMSGLDPRARTMVKDVLLAARKEGRTIFLSSHILADMDEICDTVAVLSGGKIVFNGTPETLRKTTKQDNLERAFLRVIA